MLTTHLDRFLWAATFLGNIVLLGILWTRRRASSYPVFTALIAVAVIRTVILYAIVRHASLYFYSYWTLAVADVLLQLGVFYRVAANVFCPLGVWARDIRNSFVTLVCGSMLFAAFLTWLASPPTPSPIEAVMIRGNFFSATLMSELFVGMMVLSATAGLPWKTHVARIAQGLGVYSVVCVAIDTYSGYFGVYHDAHTYTPLSHFQIWVYLACAGYWIVTLWHEAPAPRELPEPMRRQIHLLQERTDRELKRLRTWRDR